MPFSDKEKLDKLLSKVDETQKNSVNVDFLDRQFSILYLPSQGHYYPDGTDSLLIRYLSAKEEAVLTDHMLVESGHAMRMVLDNLIVSDFNIDQLLAGDFHAISMFLRSNAYGNKIELDVTCPNCKHEEKKKLRLDSFQMKDIRQLPDEGNIISCTLPLSKVKVTIKIPTFKDEIYFEREGIQNSLRKFNVLIQDFAGKTNEDFINENLMNLPIRDVRFLKKFLEDSTPGVDTSFQHQCTKCDHEFKSSFAIGDGFLKLPLEYREVVMNEVFLCHYYGKGISKLHAESMPTFHRSWTINRIQEELDKKQKAEERAQKKSQNSARSRKGRSYR